jgi:acyl-CoA dehydrogenase
LPPRREVAQQHRGRLRHLLDGSQVRRRGRRGGLGNATDFAHVLFGSGSDLGLGGGGLESPQNRDIAAHVSSVAPARYLMGMIFNPHTYDPSAYDPETQRQLKALIAFFENKGLAEMKDEFHNRTWYQDFLDFNAKEGILATFGTPAAVGGGEARWDMARINDLNEILGFYSLSYWYAWQVTVLGLGPVWMSDNEDAKQLVGKLLESGAIFGFGLSEQSHGADIYSTDMILTPTEGGWVANGPKYYIGNGNVAGRLSVFGKFADTDEYVFFLVDTQAPEYELQKNVVSDQMYVSAFALHDYPVTQVDVLHTGKDAWDAALATVNVGKVNLGWASIGICEHAFFEAVTHADHRVLYGNKVTTFAHVRRMFADAYARLLAMKLYSARSADYFRCASAEDRRFLLFNPITKMKVTSEGERVIDLLWEVIAARGFENDTYFEQAAEHIRALPKLEGTVHVNLALVLKFLPQYLMGAGQYPEIPVRQDAADDAYLFAQGHASGLGKIMFAPWRPALEQYAHLPNVALFLEQVDAFTQLIMTAPPSPEQQKDLDFLLTLGQLFTQVVYAQLVCEAAGQSRPGTVSDLSGLGDGHIDRIFAVFVQDVSDMAVTLHGQASATDAQRAGALALIRAPQLDPAAENAFVDEVLRLSDAYVMPQ